MLQIYCKLSIYSNNSLKIVSGVPIQNIILDILNTIPPIFGNEHQATDWATQRFHNGGYILLWENLHYWRLHISIIRIESLSDINN